MPLDAAGATTTAAAYTGVAGAGGAEAAAYAGVADAVAVYAGTAP